MLANATVTITQTIDWCGVFTSIGVTAVFALCIFTIIGFIYIWTTVSEIKSTVDDIYEIVYGDDKDENTTKKKEKSSNE